MMFTVVRKKFEHKMPFLVFFLVVSPVRALLCPPLLHPEARSGYKLTGHLITTYSFLGDREVCIEACSAHSYCNSVNLYRAKKKCELNTANHMSNPENMTAASDSEYIDYPQRRLKCSNRALGMEDGRIADRQITASSIYNPELNASNARLNLISSEGKQKAWSVKYNDLNQWLQVDLLRQVHVYAIASQGFYGLGQWVRSYDLQYSNDGVMFTNYTKTLEGNINSGSTVKNGLIPAINGRYIRVLPKSWQHWIAMRIELYGCDV